MPITAITLLISWCALALPAIVLSISWYATILLICHHRLFMLLVTSPTTGFSDSDMRIFSQLTMMLWWVQQSTPNTSQMTGMMTGLVGYMIHQELECASEGGYCGCHTRTGYRGLLWVAPLDGGWRHCFSCFGDTEPLQGPHWALDCLGANLYLTLITFRFVPAGNCWPHYSKVIV